jgi:hypothetical protein
MKRTIAVVLFSLSYLSLAQAQQPDLPSNAVGFLYNNGTGTLSWSVTDSWGVSAPTPSFSPAAGEISSGSTVTASCPGDTNCYASLDGITLAPSCSNAVTSNTTVYARCEQAGKKPTNAIASYTISNGSGGEGPPVGTVPAFGGELFNFASGSTSTPPGICSLWTDVPVGATVVVIGQEDGPEYHIVGITDSKGNNYTQDIYYNNAAGYQVIQQSMWSAPVTTALTTLDTITIRWSGTGLWRSYALDIVYITGAAYTGQPDGNAANNAYMYSPTVRVPGTTSAANTIVLGTLAANSFAWTPAPNWTAYRTNAININYYFFYKVLNSAGSLDPAGGGATGGQYSGVWTAFK